MKKHLALNLLGSFSLLCLLAGIIFLSHKPQSPVLAGPDRPAGAVGTECAPLPPPSGTVVPVDSVSALATAVNTATPNTTILIADGIYNLNGVYLRIDVPNVTLRSASGNREAVILDGNYETTEIIQIVASDVTVADVTLREAYNHPIHVMTTDAGDTLNTLIYNVHIIDPGEQAIKINPAVDNTYPDDGVIACSHLELTDAGRTEVRNCYTGGIDAHQAEGWVIRDNLIEGFWCDKGLSEHGIHLWRGCRDTLVERNVLRENARGIGFGLAESGDGRTYTDNPCPTAEGSYVDHYGGLIRNNVVFASDSDLFASDFGFDCGICLWQACGAQIFNNTVVSTQAPFSSIEWRFANTDVTLTNNLVSHNLRDRGGTAVLNSNLANAPLSLFVNGTGGDLHLLSTAVSAIDQAAPLAAVTDDVDGDVRPYGAATDIGADELNAPPFEPTDWVYLPLTHTE
jgi:hypothetical protein